MDQETNIFWYTVEGRNPNHQLIDGKHPIIYRVSTIRLVVQENHPQYGGFHKCGFPQNGWFIMENP